MKIEISDDLQIVGFPLRKVIWNKSTLPNDDAIFKVPYWAIRNASQKMDDADT